MLVNPLSSQIKRIDGTIRSGSPAAYFSILIKILGFLSRPVDRLLSEETAAKELPDMKLPPVLMIVGTPRCGSTIAYQVLAKSIPCIYISNMHSLLPGYASVYMHRHGKFGSFSSDFHNYYGHTSSLFDVNEGNLFFESFISEGADDQIIRRRFIHFVQSMGASSRHPMICKNIGMYHAIDRLHSAIPEITFLRIVRQEEQTIQSVLRAYHELGGFNPVPDHLKNSQMADPVEFAVAMITSLNQIIDIKKKSVRPSAWYEWSYGELCRNPWPMIEKLATNCFGLDKSRLRNDSFPPLKASISVKVTPKEAGHISTLLDHYTTKRSLRSYAGQSSKFFGKVSKQKQV